MIDEIQIAQLLNKNLSRAGMARALQVPRTEIDKFFLRHKKLSNVSQDAALRITVPVNKMPVLLLIKAMLQAGESLISIAASLGLTRQRVHQIITSNKDLNSVYVSLQSKDAADRLHKKELKAAAKREAYVRRYGPYNHKEEVYKIIRKKFNSKKSAANNKGLEFDLDFLDIEWPDVCPVLGIPLDYSMEGRRTEASPSFDRLDPNSGYVKDNVRIISWRANRIKNDGNALEHRQIAEYLDRCTNRIST